MGVSLRKLTRTIGIDASNYSKFERGKIRSCEKLEQIASYLFDPHTETEYKTLYTMIAVSRQPQHPVYDQIIQECIDKRRDRLAKQWMGRALLSKEEIFQMLDKYDDKCMKDPAFREAYYNKEL